MDGENTALTTRYLMMRRHRMSSAGQLETDF